MSNDNLLSGEKSENPPSSMLLGDFQSRAGQVGQLLFVAQHFYDFGGTAPLSTKFLSFIKNSLYIQAA